MQDPVSPEPPKKRRRRIPTSGAAEDCSGCRKRGVQCDRRRPYCSQCLESSGECPGYRTTLTWGVGVASRGKLRGLSLPVANSAPSAASQPSPSTPSTSTPLRPRANTFHDPYSALDEADDSRKKRVRLTPIRTDQPYTSQHEALPSTAVPFTNPFPPLPFQPTSDWQVQQLYDQRQSFSTPDPSYRSRGDLFPLHTAVGTTFQNLPWAPSPVSTQQPRSYAASTATTDSPVSSYPRTPSGTQSFDPYFPALAAATAAPTPVSIPGPSLQFSWQLSHPEQSPSGHQTPLVTSAGLAPYGQEEQYPFPANEDSTVQDTVSIISSDTSDHRPSLQRTYSATQPLSANIHDQSSSEPSDLTQNDALHRVVNTDSESLSAEEWFSKIPLELSSSFFQLHPRMQYLLNYYDQSICPVLVAHDGPMNPYRQHVMKLAVNSPGLQSAIAALTKNNLRMRRLKEIPRSQVDNLPDRERIMATIGVPDAEEQHYKARSIEYLNAQLSDPVKARDDSVLATLLILCLFHVCDSGFSKFKTQLAGVQKLLKMRGGFGRSEFVVWVEMFFAWFDVMTSAVNDRETLLHGGSLDILDLSNSLRDVEHFSGCDGRLFKLIARLSRLNLLSQSRPVRELPDPQHSERAAPAKDFYSLPRDEHEVRDYLKDSTSPPSGGFTSTVPVPSVPVSPLQNVAITADERHEFWREWQNIRERLEAWQPAEPPCLPNTDDPRAAHDMQHMSESFRSAALLYVERLARPAAPCEAPNLQVHVDATLAHVRAIGENSCVTKFLLWPIFIAGTEAVTGEQRALIRARCEEILRESGFYNNVSGLEVLERIWATGRDPGHTPGEGPLRWRKCMERADGEYIVI